jgi:hypothetical protein
MLDLQCMFVTTAIPNHVFNNNIQDKHDIKGNYVILETAKVISEIFKELYFKELRGTLFWLRETNMI